MITCVHSDNSGAQVFTDASFGQGTGKIWLDNVTCIGVELALMNCTASSSGVNSCTHAQDAGVRCPTGEAKLCILAIKN